MGWKSGENLLFLNNERQITTRRLWASRVIVFLAWLSPTSTAAENVGPAYALGSLIGLLAVYWLLLRLLSTTDAPSESDGYSDDSVSSEPDDSSENKIIETLSENDVVTKRELQKAVFPVSEYDDKAECWEDHIKPYLKNHDDIEQLDSSGRRWQLST